MSIPDWRFGRFDVQTRERRLLMDGAPVPIGARAFDLLTVLLERAGSLVTKSELLDRVWPGLVVEENNIAAQVLTLRKVLGNGLIVTVPGHGYRFSGQPVAIGPAVAQVPAPVPAPQPAAMPTLVVSGPLFGRAPDLQQLQAAMRLPGFVSLVGPGGVGKTTLARAFLERTPWPPDGDPGTAPAPGRPPVWVDLATLTDGAQVLPALARALGTDLPAADATAVLAAALGRHPLLVLDNAEHLREPVAGLLAQLFEQAPGLRVLVTTQAPLAMPQERVHLLEPLRIADADAEPEQALHTDAIGLLVARACAADNRLRIGPAQLPTLRALCSQLDGLPLALEMAAARVPLLGLQGVHDALAERFALLRRAQRHGTSRHQTLHAALSWSHALLPPEAQQLFHQLGVFAGGFTLDLMLAVAGGTATDRWALIDRLAMLVDHSLVVTLPGDAGQAPRYRLLETMQAFAVEQLRASGDAPAVLARHAHAVEAFLRRSLASKDACVGEAHARLIAQALAEFDNARTAWQWAIQHDVACAAGISAAAAGLAPTTPWRAEVLGWLQACETLLDARVPLATQALWWTEFAHQLLLLRSKRGSDVARRACTLAQATGDDLLQFWSQTYLARSFVAPDPQAQQACAAMQALLACHPEWPDRVRLHAAGTQALVAYYAQDFAQALRGFQDEQAIAERLQLRDAVEVAECNAIALMQLLGRRQEGVAATRIALQRMGQRHSMATAYLRINMLDSLVALGRLDEATQEADATWQLARRFDAVHTAGEVFAKLALGQGRPRAAARLHGHWRGLCALRNAVPEVDASSDDLEARIRSALADTPGALRALEPHVLDDPAVQRLLLGNDDAL